VNKLCIFVGLTVGSTAGWMLGDRWGMEIAFVLSSVGSLLGVYLGWKLARVLDR
jgi:hypothetical protein